METFVCFLLLICKAMKMIEHEFENIYSSIWMKLTALVRKFGKAVYITLDVEDIVQEALIAFWELSEKGYPIRNAEALLVKITKNICVSRLRKHKFKTTEITSEKYLGGELASKETDKMDEEMIKKKLYECLTKKEREYMLMKTDDGLSLDEIAQKTGNTKQGIKVALSKAKKKLKEQFNKNEYDR